MLKMFDLSNWNNFYKNIGLRKCIICHHWYFLKIDFRIQSEVYDDLHDLVQKAIIFNDAEIVFVKQNDYRIHFCIRVEMKP